MASGLFLPLFVSPGGLVFSGWSVRRLRQKLSVESVFGVLVSFARKQKGIVANIMKWAASRFYGRANPMGIQL